ncbi:hypothetical protein M501DRAFT_283071 [Patellaria atrata CBS 101060]|uniref:DNA damage-inducible protein 1 n=1 Tax=Patellaria atrata CBS 101060 TaxID=1346257 RepID=A0A9P4S4G9_9PEZI|nr:hypothetical protein M501DRAFT_283071 [Patellaria atrata CBS 101060]
MPRITISINAPNETNDQELLTLDLPGHLTVADLKGFVQAETNFPTPSQHFYLNGQPLLGDHKTLEEAGIKDGEMLAMLIRRPGASPRGGSSAAQQQRRPGGRRRGDDLDPGEVETTRLRILGSPAALQQIRHQKPELAETVNDPVRFREVWLRLKREEEDYERERQNQIALLNEDPFNVEAQKRIEEMIRQERVIENLQHAYENNPEVFGRVHMLYIAAEVNGHPVKAFVDSGAFWCSGVRAGRARSRSSPRARSRSTLMRRRSRNRRSRARMGRRLGPRRALSSREK